MGENCPTLAYFSPTPAAPSVNISKIDSLIGTKIPHCQKVQDKFLQTLMGLPFR